MADVDANTLTAKTTLGSNDSAILVDQTTNEGSLIDLDVLADKVLDRITSKTFTNQVGGSSAATILAQLATLNSNTTAQYIVDQEVNNGYFTATPPAGWVYSNAQASRGIGLIAQQLYRSGTAMPLMLIPQIQTGNCNVYVRDGAGNRPADGTLINLCLIWFME